MYIVGELPRTHRNTQEHRVRPSLRLHFLPFTSLFGLPTVLFHGRGQQASAIRALLGSTTLEPFKIKREYFPAFRSIIIRKCESLQIGIRIQDVIWPCTNDQRSSSANIAFQFDPVWVRAKQPCDADSPDAYQSVGLRVLSAMGISRPP